MAPGKKQRNPKRPAPGQEQPLNNASKSTPPSIPLELQQIILDVFYRAFRFEDASTLQSTIQEVKGHLYNRDFVNAFAKQSYLDAYAIRWSATRALGYADVFLHNDLRKVWFSQTSSTREGSHVVTEPKAPLEPPLAVTPPSPDLKRASACKVACIGGGAGAEVAALSVVVASLCASQVSILAVDMANWAPCLQKLETALTTPPTLSPYASESAKAANRPVISSELLKVDFTQQDVLALDPEILRMTFADRHLVTIMFTLNELFGASIARTTSFLLALTDAMALGSWLLVVDSPGSYSEVKLGSGTKQYPMKWLMDHALTGTAKGKWEKRVEDESRWFRVMEKLRYPIELENMRYQIHLYERV